MKKNVGKKWMNFMQLIELVFSVFIGKYDYYQMGAILEERQPFVGGPPMDCKNRFYRWRSFFQDIGLTDYENHLENKPFDISERDAKRLIFVPNGLTVKSLEELVSSSNLSISINVIQLYVGEPELLDARPNIESPVRVVIDNEIESCKNDVVKVSENTILERLLYWLMYHRETGRFLDLDTFTLCKGTTVAGDDSKVAAVSFTARRLNSLLNVDVEIELMSP
jgi:hypothetical protein